MQILDWFVQMCLAIKHIHDRKILHRDIKSQVCAICRVSYLSGTGKLKANIRAFPLTFTAADETGEILLLERVATVT